MYRMYLPSYYLNKEVRQFVALLPTLFYHKSSDDLPGVVGARLGSSGKSQLRFSPQAVVVWWRASAAVTRNNAPPSDLT